MTETLPYKRNRKQNSVRKRYIPRKEKLLSAKNININTKKKLIKTYNQSVILYGCETWRINKNEKNLSEGLQKKVLEKDAKNS